MFLIFFSNIPVVRAFAVLCHVFRSHRSRIPNDSRRLLLRLQRSRLLIQAQRAICQGRRLRRHLSDPFECSCSGAALVRGVQLLLVSLRLRSSGFCRDYRRSRWNFASFQRRSSVYRPSWKAHARVCRFSVQTRRRVSWAILGWVFSNLVDWVRGRFVCSRRLWNGLSESVPPFLSLLAPEMPIRPVGLCFAL